MEINRLHPLGEDQAEPKHKSRKGNRWVLISVCVVAAVVVTVGVTLAATGVWKVGKTWQGVTAGVGGWFKAETVEISSKSSDYWAVFLTNNQVYFGKLVSQTGQEIVLRDIFYLRAQRQLQPITEEDAARKEGESAPRQQVQLIKLGSELHGPVDEIRFNRDNVLFVEKLKADSRVVAGIEQYKLGKIGE